MSQKICDEILIMRKKLNELYNVNELWNNAGKINEIQKN